MSGKRKFDFSSINKALATEEKQRTIKEASNIRETNIGQNVAETNLESDEADKTVVTEQIGKLGRTTDYKKAFNFKLVPRKKIVFHKGNDFPMEEIEKRAESILEVGLIHNLEALYDEEQDIYILESGEKRTRAIDMLIEKYSAYTGDTGAADYKNYLKNVKQFEVEGYPVNVKYFDPAEYDFEEDSAAASELKSIDSQIRVNRANTDVLALDSVLLRKKIEETAELYTRRNSLVKKEARVNVNETVAEEFHITSRQIQNYKAISKLIPELQELFDKKGINIKEGAGYAKLSEADQRQLAYLHPNGKEGTVTYEKTVIINKLLEDAPEKYRVGFYVGADLYKEYIVMEGSVHGAPAEPQSEGLVFYGWIDENGYLADFSQPVTRDLAYYADMR